MMEKSVEQEMTAELDQLKAEESAPVDSGTASPEASPEASPDPDFIPKAEAEMTAGMAVVLVQMRWPGVVIDQASKELVIVHLEPVLAKYGGYLPAWLIPYKEELQLAQAVLMIGVSAYSQVKAAQPVAVQEQKPEKAQEQAKDTETDRKSGDALVSEMSGSMDQ